MNIVIAGAGGVCFYLANLLAKENHNISIIDNNEDILSKILKKIDVMTIQGNAGSIEILENAEVKKADLFIAVTNYEITNLMTAILAKQLGAKRTLARIFNTDHLQKDNKQLFHQLGIDVLISPQLLASIEIGKLLQRASFTDIYDFEEGKIWVVGITIDKDFPFINRSLSEIEQSSKDFSFTGIALLRGEKTIIPQGDTVLIEGDQLYVSTVKSYLEKFIKFVGKKIKPIKNVMIVGDTELALRTAQHLEDDYDLSLIVDKVKVGKKFLKVLNKCLIIHGNPGDVDTLKEEGLAQMDAFIALTKNTETNIITSLMAKELGVYKTIALIENINYTHISQNLGIDTIINQKMIAASEIFRYVRKGKVEAIVTLPGVNAEIIEFVIHKDNEILEKPIKELPLKNKIVIAGIVRKEQVFIPTGNTYFQLNDKVIILAFPEMIQLVEKIFN